MKIIQVFLNNIDLSSEDHDRYLFNYRYDSNALVDSIKDVGLINPVTLMKTGMPMEYILLYAVISVSRFVRNWGTRVLKQRL